MRLTTFTDYSLRVLMYLALQPERRATIPEVAAAYTISPHHLTKVVHHLGRTGVIETLRGKAGGMRLAHAPDAIRLGALIRTCESDAAVVECLGREPGTCCIAPACGLAPILQEAVAAFYASLDRHTLADLVQRPQVLRPLLRIGS
jgi:Rrf2 family nitric oxide-sensitive transcriptional repressor